jgi:hypothetical protein
MPTRGCAPPGRTPARPRRRSADGSHGPAAGTTARSARHRPRRTTAWPGGAWTSHPCWPAQRPPSSDERCPREQSVPTRPSHAWHRSGHASRYAPTQADSRNGQGEHASAQPRRAHPSPAAAAASYAAATAPDPGTSHSRPGPGIRQLRTGTCCRSRCRCHRGRPRRVERCEDRECARPRTGQKP